MFIDVKVLIGDSILDVAEVKLRRMGLLIEFVGDEYVRLIQSEILEDDMQRALQDVPEELRRRSEKLSKITNRKRLKKCQFR